MRQLIGVFDEHTSREISKNTTRAMRESAKQGFWNGATPPLGYKNIEAERRGQKIKKKLAIDAVEAETVKLIYAGADVLVRGKWKGARWRDKNGQPIDFLAMLRAAKGGRIDRPIVVERKGGPNLALRLVAIRKPQKAAAEARRKARRDAQREGYQVSKGTLEAADWVILLTSLPPDDFSAQDILDLYRLRWRIELGFKRLKSLIGLKGPPGFDERSARPYVLVHLLIILLLEPLVDGLEDSPPVLAAA
jgi:hypothetical protein